MRPLWGRMSCLHIFFKRGVTPLESNTYNSQCWKRSLTPVEPSIRCNDSKGVTHLYQLVLKEIINTYRAADTM
jgi:hypothetical protein